jgi:MFS transporter, ACS family, glucarate transporter
MPRGLNIPLRSRILTLVALAAGITYLDRVCISVATPDIMRTLKLSKIQMGYAFGVFAVAYGIAEIPTGWLTDRLGQRKMLTWIVALWSIFTALTGCVWEFRGLIAVRFLFGAAEAGAFPSLARAIGHWFHPTDQGRASGVMWMGARIGGAIAPLLATLFLGWFGWRVPFSLFGLVGGAWCFLFWRTYRDDPARHPEATAADLEYIRLNSNSPGTAHGGPTPWKQILQSRNLWSIFWMYSATSYGFWFLLTWLPTYLIQQHGVSTQRAGMYAALPLAVGAVSSVTGGALSDLLVRRIGSLMWGRRIVGLAGFLIAAVGFVAAGFMVKGGPAILCLMLAEMGLDLAMPIAWAVCLEVGGDFGGTVSAFMNTGSCATAFISPVAAAWIYTRFHSFDMMLMSAGVVYFLAGLLWLEIDATKAVTSDE